MRFSVGKLSYFNTLMWAEGGGLQTSQQKLHGPNCQNQPRTWTKIGARGCYRQKRKYICMITYKYSHQELYHDKFKFRLISPYLVCLVPSSYHFPFFCSALIFSSILFYIFSLSLSYSTPSYFHTWQTEEAHQEQFRRPKAYNCARQSSSTSLTLNLFSHRKRINLFRHWTSGLILKKGT